VRLRERNWAREVGCILETYVKTRGLFKICSREYVGSEM
jgi:hypothetical protein